MSGNCLDPVWEFFAAIGRWLYYISPALVAVLVGGFFINRFFVRKSNLATLVERICDCLDTLRDDAGEYWSVDYTPETKADLVVLEAKIKGDVLHINALIRMLSERPGARLIDALSEEIANLQDACTGGSFETVTRVADRQRYLKIVGVINRLSIALHRLKI